LIDLVYRDSELFEDDDVFGAIEVLSVLLGKLEFICFEQWHSSDLKIK